MGQDGAYEGWPNQMGLHALLRRHSNPAQHGRTQQQVPQGERGMCVPGRQYVIKCLYITLLLLAPGVPLLGLGGQDVDHLLCWYGCSCKCKDVGSRGGTVYCCRGVKTEE